MQCLPDRRSNIEAETGLALAVERVALSGRPGGAERLWLPERALTRCILRSNGCPGCSATATVLGCQAHGTSSVRHGVRCLSIAFRMINSFRMHAVRATFFAFPVAHKR